MCKLITSNFRSFIQRHTPNQESNHEIIFRSLRSDEFLSGVDLIEMDDLKVDFLIECNISNSDLDPSK